MLDDILFQYQNLLHKIGRICSRLEKLYAEHLVCKPGCSHCCQVERSVLSIEAYIIEQKLKTFTLQRIRRLRRSHKKNDEHCPLLWKNRCVVFHERPIICRTHGLPIYYHEAEITFIDYCRLNFTELPPDNEFDEKHVLDMNKFNEDLTRIDILFSEQILNKKWQPDNRIPLKRILNDIQFNKR